MRRQVHVLSLASGFGLASGEDGGVGDAEGSLSGPGHTKEGAAEAAALDD